PPNQVEALLVEAEEDHVADHVSVVVARHEVLGTLGSEVGEAVDGQALEQGEGAGTFHHQLGHVVGLVEENGGGPPCSLFVPPVAELGGHHRIHVGPDLGVAQHVDGVADRLEDVFQAPLGHLLLLGSGSRAVRPYAQRTQVSRDTPEKSPPAIPLTAMRQSERAAAIRSRPETMSSSAAARETLTAPCPRSPNVDPGATATPCSTTRRRQNSIGSPIREPSGSQR